VRGVRPDSGRKAGRTVRDDAAEVLAVPHVLVALVDLVELELALLVQAQQAEDVAARVGYSEPAAFVRAFQCWKGAPPGRYRQGV